MNYPAELIPATLIRRYKRFLADVVLDDGSELTVHCPNTGSMKRCAEPGWKVWLADSANPKRKYRYTLEWVLVDGSYRACVNTAQPNRVIGEALRDGRIPRLTGYDEVQSEPRVEDGRLDFCLHKADGARCWVEVKSVTLLEQDNGLGCFPDAVTERGLKHLRRLAELKKQGDRAVLVFCVPHEGIREVSAAEHIDPAYAAALRDVVAGGVEVLAVSVSFTQTPAAMTVAGLLPVRL
ncbi:DNA/RNA nuclease SfsA [Thalassolituus sp.]|uniref:DNA/RNA nuclease SfsA n=1 Tax=Thalassolituus sp. TaxID=2030822 RepID=UPI003512C7F0